MDLRVDDHAEPIHELGRLVGLHRLYFERPRDQDLLTIDDELGMEIAVRLRVLKMEAPDDQDPRALWMALERWAGRENLEERMVREGSIRPHRARDPSHAEHLTGQSAPFGRS